VGWYQESRCQILEIDTEKHEVKTIKKKMYYDSYFGEGLTLLDD
jgi:glutamine cyclotransferase